MIFNKNKYLITNLQNETSELKKVNDDFKGQIIQKNKEIENLNDNFQYVCSDIVIYKELLSEYLIKEIESLNQNIQHQIYEDTHYALDQDGWIELRVVSTVIPCNLYSEFSYEDNMGVFEELDGYETIFWYEKAEFGEFEYEIVGSMHEVGTCINEYWKLPVYEEYRKKVEKKVLIELCKSQPLEFKKRINEIKIILKD